MSRASAYLVRPNGKRLGEMVYCGTSDILNPGVYVTVGEAWRRYYARDGGESSWDRLQSCTERAPHRDQLESVYVHSDYGGGFWWPVRWCRTCRVVHGPLSIFELDPEWPKDGEPPIEGAAVVRELASGGGS